MRVLTTQQAVEAVLKEHRITRYKLSKILLVTPPTVYNWLNGTKMSVLCARRFYDNFTINVSDAHDTGRIISYTNKSAY